MNIAYLDPPYSRYFHELGGRLARRTGGAVLALLSSPAYEMYTGDDRHEVWNPGTVAEPPPVPEASAHALWSQTIDERFRGVFWHAVQWFREQFRAHGIGLCLVFSDARPFSLAAAVAASEAGVRCLYFERGAFRLRTASLSTLGLNARFSLREAREFDGIRGIAHDAVLPTRREEPWLKLNFVRFMLANERACVRRPERRLMQHKRYALLPYVRLTLAQWWARRRPSQHADAHLGLGQAGGVVLVPLQLPGDSQWRLHSPFATVQEFLDFVVQQAHRVAPDACILVKRHPMDSAHYRMPEGALAITGNLARFYRRHPVVVCVNSTVGFEAATRGLPVICFGDSFYTESPAVQRTARAGFADCLARALGDAATRAPDRTLLADVLRWYQAPGDTWGYTDEDLERTADIALQHWRAASAMSRTRRPDPPCAEPAPTPFTKSAPKIRPAR
ncbi:MAG: hypothetical protein U1E63_17755 [Burkholderiales bacterium]